MFTNIKIDWSIDAVSLATWTAQLSTKANGHPLPVPSYARGRSVWRNDRVPEGGRAVTGGTSGAAHPEGETREWSRTVRPRLTGQLRIGGMTEGGSGALLRRGRWQLTAVKGRQKRQRPPKQRHRRAGNALAAG